MKPDFSPELTITEINTLDNGGPRSNSELSRNLVHQYGLHDKNTAEQLKETLRDNEQQVVSEEEENETLKAKIITKYDTRPWRDFDYEINKFYPYIDADICINHNHRFFGPLYYTLPDDTFPQKEKDEKLCPPCDQAETSNGNFVSYIDTSLYTNHKHRFFQPLFNPPLDTTSTQRKKKEEEKLYLQCSQPRARNGYFVIPTQELVCKY